jgi:hypothetical protein
LGYILGDYFTNSSGHPVRSLPGQDEDEGVGGDLVVAEDPVLESIRLISFGRILRIKL